MVLLLLQNKSRERAWDGGGKRIRQQAELRLGVIGVGGWGAKSSQDSILEKLILKKIYILLILVQ